MFDFDFSKALPVRARVGSGTITAIYYYYYYYYYYTNVTGASSTIPPNNNEVDRAVCVCMS